MIVEPVTLLTAPDIARSVPCSEQTVAARIKTGRLKPDFLISAGLRPRVPAFLPTSVERARHAVLGTEPQTIA